MIELLKKFLPQDKAQAKNPVQTLSGWLDLADNRVVIEYLQERIRFNEEAIQRLLLLDKDRRDLQKAQLLGAFKEVLNILNKIDQAIQIKRKQG